MKTIFEQSKTGNRAATIRPLQVEEYVLDKLMLRAELPLPEVSEVDVTRHFTALSKRAFGVDDGFYPLGSCTMKYNPKLHEEIAGLEGFTNIHPLQPTDRTQGSLAVLNTLSAFLCEITGMNGMTLQPCAGAHGEYTGLMLIGAYHTARHDNKRKKILIPDSAHGTNPASAAMAGFEVVSVKSNSEKGVDLDNLRELVGEDTAALMLTNPTTLGLFEKNIVEISKIVHEAGGLLYYDGANLNAVMGIVRPADMGFDVVHLNLHKTFATPHGAGGPGSGPVGCKSELAKFLPNPYVEKTEQGFAFADSEKSIGKVTKFYGNFGVCVKALAYILTLGGKGLKEASENAVLNANYMKARLQDIYETENDRYCMHEFVISLQKLKDETGVSAMDVAKSMIDRHMHPPTMYFPMIVHEALMFEPTETENKETLDCAVEILKELYVEAHNNPEYLHGAPHNAVIKRPDEVRAARNPIVKV
ncbi:MAG TPA: aminomethyl-transferring glycine dehydrogenase subunit GcvPB [Clostridia bacterium]|nr:aminomethyl-transferring glycine dehydrogenase subunit GcvPB [Clostridia bacterium]